ncbi:MAG: glycosyltransferase family protein [Saprospiraceae bacterium]|nr:glycosyltransferase family protein [Saprospiraceae bacterium]
MNKVLTVVQARCGSMRFPGKILMPVLGESLLFRMMERLSFSELKGEIVIATTDQPQDDLIQKLCDRNNWNCFRGNETDLLDRHYQAAKNYGADIVLKIPSDCPLIDYRIIDQVITVYLNGNFDYVSNLHPASFPDGNDVEVMSFETLERAWLCADKDFEKEHTTPYVWERPDQFRIGNYVWERGKDLSMSHRFTIDYPEDYEFIKAVFEVLYPANPSFSLTDILHLLDLRPDIFQLNHHFAGVNWYRNHMNELKTIDYSQTKVL